MEFSLFDHLFDYIVVCDHTGHIVYVNDSAAGWLQSSVRRLSGGKRKLKDLVVLESLSLDQNFALDSGKVDLGWTETRYDLKEVEAIEGMIQVYIKTFSIELQKFCFYWFHDVSLEEKLHRKYQAELIDKELAYESLAQAKALLEEYSKNLELKVAERTRELTDANKLLETIMNSLGQGFLVFNDLGECLDFYTKICETILEKSPSGKRITEVLGLSSRSEQEMFEDWMKATFSRSLSFEMMKGLAPQAYNHSAGKVVELDYFPLYSEENLEKVVVVATDKTEEVEAKKALEEQRQQVRSLLGLIELRHLFGPFYHKTKRFLENLNISVSNSEAWAGELRRELHTVEGEAGLFGMVRLREELKVAQNLIEYVKPERTETLEAFRISILCCVERLKEFASSHHSLLEALKVNVDDTVPALSYSKEREFLRDLEGATNDPQVVEKYRSLFIYESLKSHLNRYRPLIREIGQKLNKNVQDLQIEGEDCQIDPEKWSDLLANLVHVFRNAMDHGIETEEERQLSEKSEAPFIKCKVEVESGFVTLKIEDNGRGINTTTLLKKAKDRFPDEDFDKLDESQVQQLIFRDRFSSRDKVTEFSGRGVGLEAVEVATKKLGGRVFVSSKMGKGTQFVIKIPIGVEAKHKKVA